MHLAQGLPWFDPPANQSGAETALTPAIAPAPVEVVLESGSKKKKGSTGVAIGSTRSTKAEDPVEDDMDIKPNEEARVKLPKPRKTRATKKQAQDAITVSWKVIRSPSAAFAAAESLGTEHLPIRRPSIWCSSKEELLFAIPPLAKITNGVSWTHNSTPVIFLEDPDDREGEAVIGVENVNEDGNDILELVMTRDFTCPVSQLRGELNSEPEEDRFNGVKNAPAVVIRNLRGDKEDAIGSQLDSRSRRAPAKRPRVKSIKVQNKSSKSEQQLPHEDDTSSQRNRERSEETTIPFPSTISGSMDINMTPVNEVPSRFPVSGPAAPFLHTYTHFFLPTNASVPSLQGAAHQPLNPQSLSVESRSLFAHAPQLGPPTDWTPGGVPTTESDPLRVRGGALKRARMDEDLVDEVKTKKGKRTEMADTVMERMRGKQEMKDPTLSVPPTREIKNATYRAGTAKLPPSISAPPRAQLAIPSGKIKDRGAPVTTIQPAQIGAKRKRADSEYDIGRRGGMGVLTAGKTVEAKKLKQGGLDGEERLVADDVSNPKITGKGKKVGTGANHLPPAQPPESQGLKTDDDQVKKELEEAQLQEALYRKKSENLRKLKFSKKKKPLTPPPVLPTASASLVINSSAEVLEVPPRGMEITDTHPLPLPTPMFPSSPGPDIHTRPACHHYDSNTLETGKREGPQRPPHHPTSRASDHHHPPDPPLEHSRFPENRPEHVQNNLVNERRASGAHENEKRDRPQHQSDYPNVERHDSRWSCDIARDARLAPPEYSRRARHWEAAVSGVAQHVVSERYSKPWFLGNRGSVREASVYSSGPPDRREQSHQPTSRVTLPSKELGLTQLPAKSSQDQVGFQDRARLRLPLPRLATHVCTDSYNKPQQPTPWVDPPSRQISLQCLPPTMGQPRQTNVSVPPAPPEVRTPAPPTDIPADCAPQIKKTATECTTKGMETSDPLQSTQTAVHAAQPESVPTMPSPAVSVCKLVGSLTHPMDEDVAGPFASAPSSSREEPDQFPILPSDVQSDVLFSTKQTSDGLVFVSPPVASSSKVRLDPPPHIPVASPSTDADVMAPASQPIVSEVLPKQDPSASVPPQIPAKAPAEIDVLINAYISGLPVILVATQTMLRKRWSHFHTPPECRYAYLGCFFVVGVQERRVEVTVVPERKKGSVKTLAVDEMVLLVSGRTEWRFKLRWGPSEREWSEVQKSGQDFLRPWWSTDRNGKRKEQGQGQEYESFEDWSEARYRKTRMGHQNYRLRTTPMWKLFHTVLPTWMEVVGRQRTRDTKDNNSTARGRGGACWGWGLADESFPTGWYCAECGKVNYQVMFRHRRCSSSFCKTKAPPKSYAFTVQQLRDPRQNTAMSHPFNSYPSSAVEVSVTEWEDGMQTFEYTVKQREDVVIKHIFTGNTPLLQEDANRFLKEVQLEVPIERPRKNSIPYFTYTAGSSGMSWEAAPRCLVGIKEALQHFGRGYGEVELTINHLTVMAWVTTGSKKSTTAFSGIKHSVVIMFLGCEAALTLVPKSGLQHSVVQAGPQEDSLPTEANASLAEDDKKASVAMDVDEPVTTNATTETETSVSTRKPTAKADKRAIVVTMVHGDMMVLSGDNFEYSIRREGTGILLIGECR